MSFVPNYWLLFLFDFIACLFCSLVNGTFRSRYISLFFSVWDNCNFLSRLWMSGARTLCAHAYYQTSLFSTLEWFAFKNPDKKFKFPNQGYYKLKQQKCIFLFFCVSVAFISLLSSFLLQLPVYFQKSWQSFSIILLLLLLTAQRSFPCFSKLRVRIFCVSTVYSWIFIFCWTPASDEN